jgi:hypothetical protein
MLRKLELPLLFLFLFAFARLVSAQEKRHFTFHYGFTVKNIPAGERVRIWIPTAEPSDFQEVRVVSANGDLPLKKTRESKYGNQMYFAETSKAKQSELHFEIVYDIVRHERVILGTYSPHLESVKLKDRDRNDFLAPDRLVPVTGLPAQLAASVAETESTHLDKAHAIYDYVFANMRYDKTGTGWGRGDVLYACEAKKGNCTDFHHCSSPWPVRKAFQHGLRLDFHCPSTSTPRKSPDTIAGRISLNRSTDGFPWTFPKPGSIQRKRAISSERSTLIACSSAWAAIYA